MKRKITLVIISLLLLIAPCITTGGGVVGGCKSRVYTECLEFGADAETCAIMARKTCD